MTFSKWAYIVGTSEQQDINRNTCDELLLTHLPYFLWDYVESNVWRKNLQLKDEFVHVISEIKPYLFRNIIENLNQRERCTRAESLWIFFDFQVDWKVANTVTKIMWAFVEMH